MACPLSTVGSGGESRLFKKRGHTKKEAEASQFNQNKYNERV